MTAEAQNPSVIPFIRVLKEKVLSGGEISFAEAVRLASIKDAATVDVLLDSAHEITLKFRTNEPDLCALVNAKSYLCGEDCAFCSQSSRYRTDASRYPLMDVDTIVEAAKRSEAAGVKSFCVVTSGETLNAEEFATVREAFRRISEETSLEVDGSLGALNEEQISGLKAVGMRRFNHNLQCSREFYPKIVSTHTYEERKQTLGFLQKEGVEVCSGGIFGMGESCEDRVRLAFELKPYGPRCFPVNILNPRPGTPLEKQEPLDPVEALKAIAIYRFIHPRANIKLAGGKELNLGCYFQEKALKGGANGLVVGGYLTTAGNPVAEDLVTLRRAGYNIPCRMQ